MFKSRRIVAIAIFVAALIIPALTQFEETVDVTNIGISATSPNRVSWAHQLLPDGDYLFIRKSPWFNFWSDASEMGIRLSTIDCEKDSCSARELLDQEMDFFVTAEEAQTLQGPNVIRRDEEGSPILHGGYMLQTNIEYIDVSPVVGCKTSAARFDLRMLFTFSMPGLVIALDCGDVDFAVVAYGTVKHDYLNKATLGLVKSIRLPD